MLALAREQRVPVVIVEFSSWCGRTPSPPYLVQNAFAPLRAEREVSRARPLLWGSGDVLHGPVAERPARLRCAAEPALSWSYQRSTIGWRGSSGDRRTALKINAIVGDTPA